MWKVKYHNVIGETIGEWYKLFINRRDAENDVFDTVKNNLSLQFFIDNNLGKHTENIMKHKIKEYSYYDFENSDGNVWISIEIIF